MFATFATRLKFIELLQVAASFDEAQRPGERLQVKHFRGSSLGSLPLSPSVTNGATWTSQSASQTIELLPSVATREKRDDIRTDKAY